MKLEERVRQAAENLDKYHGEHVDIIFKNDFPGKVELVAYLNEVRPHVILNILDRLDKVQPVLKEAEESIRVVEAAIGDITQKEIDTNDCVGMLNRYKKAMETALNKFRGEN